ncbi:hypothetical protein XM38_035790 [Halomicronema hongdechloris C2206]|uniref:Uncharacterized protein n=1 Tax=Halomicronema hongdechloris C2206 TaxID=1641165 RepID=A0A1Z3HQN6_9CYAN|nr:hypothetical protein XM38_035790 [Halomicronema hongdechloris C2206]
MAVQEKADSVKLDVAVRGHLKTRLKALQGKRFRAYDSVGQNPEMQPVPITIHHRGFCIQLFLGQIGTR